MHHLLVLLLAFSAEARFSPCALLLPGPAREEPAPDASRLRTAELWLEAHAGEPIGLDRFLEDHGLARASMPASTLHYATATFALERWQRWSETNQVQRDAAMGLELRMLMGPSQSALIPFDGNVLITTRSAQNLARLLGRAQSLFPLTAGEDPAHVKRARTMSKELLFHFLRPHTLPPTGAVPPLASPAELRRFGLRERGESYYSVLVGGSPSVGFDLNVSRVDERTFNLGSNRSVDALRVDDGFAEASGFVLPQLTGPLDILRLMKQWNPGALDQLAHAMRYSLPNDVRTGAELFAYATRTSGAGLFGEPERLVPFRAHLTDLFMVTEDAEEFLRETFERYLRHTALNNPAAFRKLSREFGRVGGAQDLFRREFLNAIGWSGVSLRVPISVPANQYKIIRAEGTKGDPGYRHAGSPAGRLDRSYAP